MAIPRDKLQAAVEAGHPDNALIGVPVSLLREMLAALPACQPVHIGLDLARGADMHIDATHGASA